MPSKVKLLPFEDIKAMHTGTLMSRRAALLKCEESFKHSDRDGHESEPEQSATCFIEFKDTDEWQKAYGELKLVLATRENIPSRQERKAERQFKAKTSK